MVDKQPLVTLQFLDFWFSHSDPFIFRENPIYSPSSCLFMGMLERVFLVVGCPSWPNGSDSGRDDTKFISIFKI